MDCAPIRRHAELEDVGWISEHLARRADHQGILDMDDAKLANKTGATAIVVSNNGGRQLDGGASSISMLKLGARICLIGRAYIYRPGAGGQTVARAIEIIRKNLDVTMALTGVKSIDEIDQRVLVD
jgi:L-lactate dehydrogenase (cytochrome)